MCKFGRVSFDGRNGESGGSCEGIRNAHQGLLIPIGWISVRVQLKNVRR